MIANTYAEQRHYILGVALLSLIKIRRLIVVWWVFKRASWTFAVEEGNNRKALSLLLPIECDHVGAHGSPAELAYQRCDLTTVIGAVIDKMLKCLPSDVGECFTLDISIGEFFQQLLLGERKDICAHSLLDFIPFFLTAA